MVNYREIIKLKSENFSNAAIAVNVGSSRNTPIISQQASIIVDVTYRCMGYSYSLEMDKERPF